MFRSKTLLFTLLAFILSNTILQSQTNLIDELFTSKHDPKLEMISKKKVKITIEPNTEIKKYQKGGILAGMAINDITPPPGLTPGAYSVIGEYLEGFRTRLKSRAVYLKGSNGVPILVIQADLGAPSRVLHRSVASALSELTDVPFGNITIATNHVHGSWGNFFDTMLWNKRFQKDKGFDLKIFDFLKDQIIDSGVKAYQNRRPAKIASGSKEIYYLNRNRAIKSYIRNKGKEHLDPDKDSMLIYSEVNPYLKMIRIDALQDNGEYKPIGSYSFFPIHGTAISNFSKVYSADLFAYAQREVAWRINKKYNLEYEAINAFSTGSEGDMTPNTPFYNEGGQYGKEVKNLPLNFGFAEKLGLSLAQSSWELFEELGAELSDAFEIRTANREIDLIDKNEIDGIEICKRPSAGMATLNGAEGTRVVKMFLVNDASFFTRKIFYGKNRCHGNKVLPLGKIGRIIQPVKDYPRNAMFQYFELGDISVFFTPFEATITTAERIANRILSEYKNLNLSTYRNVSIVGATNDYLGYATTPEEYSNQNYEGGSTHYGKNTEPYITAQTGILVRDLLTSGGDTYFDLPNKYEIETVVANLYPTSNKEEEEEQTIERKVIQEPKYHLEDLKNVIDEPNIQFQWSDVSLENMDFHKPILSVERSKDGANWETLVIGFHPISDEGYHLEVTAVEDKKSNLNIYQGRWYYPKMEESVYYRFRVKARNNLQSDLFVGLDNVQIP